MSEFSLLFASCFSATLTHTSFISTSDNQLCAVDQLYSIQNKTGTVSVDNLTPILPQLLTAGLPVYGLPQNLSCNNCTKEAYNIVLVNDPQAITSSANSSISGQCGASFIGMSLISLPVIGFDKYIQTAKHLGEYHSPQPTVPFPRRAIAPAIVAAHLGHSHCVMHSQPWLDWGSS
jgi:hypothetical protein